MNSELKAISHYRAGIREERELAMKMAKLSRIASGLNRRLPKLGGIRR
jgi:hypothetical protein